LGILTSYRPGGPLTDAFIARLAELGHVEGRTLRIERRMVEGGSAAFMARAAELVKLRVDVIFAASTMVIQAAAKATSTIPIVFETLGDPVAAGLVKSLSHPGGNLTGTASIEAELAPKRLELIKQAVPRAARVAVLRNPANPSSPAVGAALERAAKRLSLKVVYGNVRKAAELEAVFIAMTRKLRAEALVVLPDSLFSAEREQIVELAEKIRIPAVYPFSGMAQLGGLMVYGPNRAAMYRAAAGYVDKILKGARPGDLPIAQPTQFDLAINVMTATALGLTFPQTLLARADTVIQ
jgi:putative tryptophan/tyrosine transport system substrate-binding protein